MHEDDEVKTQSFEQAITKGLESGNSTPLDMDEIINEAKIEAIEHTIVEPRFRS